MSAPCLSRGPTHPSATLPILAATLALCNTLLRLGQNFLTSFTPPVRSRSGVPRTGHSVCGRREMPHTDLTAGFLLDLRQDKPWHSGGRRCRRRDSPEILGRRVHMRAAACASDKVSRKGRQAAKPIYANAQLPTAARSRCWKHQRFDVRSVLSETSASGAQTITREQVLPVAGMEPLDGLWLGRPAGCPSPCPAEGLLKPFLRRHSPPCHPSHVARHRERTAPAAGPVAVWPELPQACYHR